MKKSKLGKRMLVMLLVLGMVLSLFGCGNKKEEPVPSTPPTTEETKEESPAPATQQIMDHNDNQVEVPTDIQRIVVCDIYPLPSVLSVFFDSAEKIVGMAAPSMAAAKNGLLGTLYPELLTAQTGFIDGTEVNTEELLKLEPDVVFYSASDPELGKKLTEAGFAAVAISAAKWEYNAVETLNQWIDLLSTMFPANDKAAVCRSYSEKTLAMVQERAKEIPEEEKKNVFFLFQYTDTSLSTSGNQFFGQWWADTIGATNAGRDLDTKQSTAVSMEQVYAWNPDLIFMTNFNPSTPEDLYGNTVGNYDWSSVAAVQEKQVYKMPLGMYRTYTAGVDTPITLLWLAKATYPDLYEDVDITEETKTYYQEVFGITLTDQQADSIFHPLAQAGEMK